MLMFSGITKTYGDIRALDDVSFSIPKGEVTGLLGLNGAGKSTAMNLIAGLLASDAGTIRLGGLDAFDAPIEYRKKIGFLPETPPLYLDLTVGEYLMTVARLKRLPKPREREVLRVMASTGIEHAKKRLIRSLSKGYRQRVGLAQALLGTPELLMLDEPTVGLDPSQVNEFRKLIREQGAQHTVLFSSHILSEVNAVCDRVLVLHRGKLVADTTPIALGASGHEIRRFRLVTEGDKETIRALITSVEGVLTVDYTDGAFVIEVEAFRDVDVRRRLFWELSAHALPILELTLLADSLEDAFIRLVTAEEGK
ncbi:MAG: ABC transporter ATP-binding protein [Clostridiales bacterium]|jgi:ABC-2 type transport system ATP-binding protein|nr:ABC transporter ATP-binding protein [Clostridiales bacterium]MDY0120012.1 ABC transporter ATP-binding protein [Clostridia bacterium]